jgi:hypothetical protein
MRKLNEILADISAAKGTIDLAERLTDPRIKANFEAASREAELQLPVLRSEFINTFRTESEVILVSGAGSEKAIETLSDLGGILVVDAQEFIRKSAESAYALNPENTLSATSYLQVLSEINALARATGVRVPKQLEYDAMDSTASLEDNMRNLVRSQFGGAGAEPAWVLFKAASVALENNIEVSPVPVAVFNLKGASTADYLSIFSSVREMSFETGTGEEVAKKLKEFATDVRKQGKIKVSTKKANKEAQQLEDQEENTNE